MLHGSSTIALLIICTAHPKTMEEAPTMHKANTTMSSAKLGAAWCQLAPASYRAAKRDDNAKQGSHVD